MPTNQASVPASVVPADRASREARNSGKANIRPNVPALPNQVTSMRRAPSGGQRERGARPRAPRGPARPRQNQSGHGAVDEDAADADEEQQPVGDRVEDLAEVGHLVEVAGDVAVDPVGGPERRRAARPPRPGCPGRTAATGTPAGTASRTSVMTFGTVRIRSSSRRRCVGRCRSGTSADYDLEPRHGRVAPSTLAAPYDRRAMPTIFTRIIAGELPGRFVWRDDALRGVPDHRPIRHRAHPGRARSPRSTTGSTSTRRRRPTCFVVAQHIGRAQRRRSPPTGSV